MADVLLADPSTDLLAALATSVSSTPIDPPGLTDHLWLYGDPRMVRERLHQSIQHSRAHDGGGWVILVDNAPAGLVKVRVDDGTAETFSFVCAHMQNRGIATAARAGLLAMLCEHPAVVLVVSTAREHSASSAISRRLGYTFAGTEIRRHPELGRNVVLERYELDP